jgi:WD40 repeat protein
MRMVQTLLSILSGIHQQGLLHGDVKPANILVPAGQPNTWTTQGLFLTQLRLVDWGNAQEPANPLPPWLMATNHHQRASAEYAAPEQLAGQPHFASDLYSVGVVGVQLLTGIAPFHWLDQGENWRLFVSHTPVNLDADLDADLCAQLDRLLNPDPHQRYGPRRSVPSAPPELIAKPVPWQLQFNLSGSQGHRAAVKALASPFEVTNPTNTSSVIPSITPFETNIPQWFASAGEDHTLRLWSYKTGELLTSVIIPHKPIQALCIEPEFPHRLLSGSADGRLQGWEIRENPDHTLDLRPLVNLHWQQPGALNALVCVAPEIFASGGTDKAIYLWHLDHPQPLITLTGHRLAIQTLAVSPESRYLASGSSDATVKIWDLSRKNLITTLKGHTAAVKTVAFSPDGQYLASAGNDRTIQLWDTQHWRIQFTLPGHGWPITQLKFTNPQTLWSSSWDYTLKCWDLSNLFRGEMQEPLQPIAHLQEHTDVVTCFIVMSHGVLISGSADHTVKIWHQHRLP